MAHRFQEHKNTDQCPEEVDGCTLQDSFFYAYDKFSNRADWGASGVDIPFDCLLKRFTDTETRRLRGKHADAGHDNAIRVAASWYLKGLQMDDPGADVDSVKRAIYDSLSPSSPYEVWSVTSPTVLAIFHDRYNTFPVELIDEISEDCRAAFARKRKQADADLARYYASAPAQVGRGIGLKKQRGGGPCPPNKVLNPATGRCVLKTGAIGKKILAAQAKTSPQKQPAAKKAAPQKQPAAYSSLVIAKKASPQKPAAKKAAPQKPAAQKQIICPPDKILNPATGRCVKKTGPVGKKLLGQQPKAKALAVQTSPQVAKGKKIIAPKLPRGQVGVRTEQWEKKRKPSGKERKALHDKCGDKCFLIPEEHKYPVCAGKGTISCDYDCDGVRAARNNAAIILNRTNLQNEKQSKDWAQRAIPVAELIGLKHCGWSVN